MIGEELELDNASDESERTAIVKKALDIFGFEPARDAADPASFEDSLLSAWASEDPVHDGRDKGGDALGIFGILGEELNVEACSGRGVGLGHAYDKCSIQTGIWQSAMGANHDLSSSTELGMIDEELDLDNASDESERMAIMKEALDISGFEPLPIQPASRSRCSALGQPSTQCMMGETCMDSIAP